MSKRLLCVAATVGLIGVRLDTGWYWTDPWTQIGNVTLLHCYKLQKDWTQVGIGSIAHVWKCYKLQEDQIFSKEENTPLARCG